MGVAAGKFVGVNVGAGVSVTVGMTVGGGVLVAVLVDGIVGEAAPVIVAASSGEVDVAASVVAAGIVAVIVGKSSATGATAESPGGSDRPMANHSHLSGSRYTTPAAAVTKNKQVRIMTTIPKNVKGNREEANRLPQPPQKEAVFGFWKPQLAHGPLFCHVIPYLLKQILNKLW